MADFAKWGVAIAIALGYSQEEFLSAYQTNIESQIEIAINENPVAVTILSFMKDKAKWVGTASELLHELNDQRVKDDKNMEGAFDNYWPTASNYLMRRIKIIEPNLEAIGIIVEKKSTGARREVAIRNTKIKEKEEIQKENYATDDIFKI